MNGSQWAWLERLTEAVLLLVVLALGWVVAAAYEPELRIAALEVEVVVVLGLLLAALLLVSVVALVHTR